MMEHALDNADPRINANVIYAKLMRSYRIKNTTNDLEQACHDMRSFWPDACVEYSGKHDYYSNVNGLILANSSFSDNATVPGLKISRLRFDDCHLISIPLAGHSSHQFQGQTYHAGKDHAVFQPAGVEISAWPITHVRTFQVTVSKTYYQQVVTGYVGPDHVPQATGSGDVDLSDPAGRNLAAMSRLMVRWLNQPGLSFENAGLVLKIFEQQFVQALLEQQARHWGFLDCQPAALPYYVRMAEEYMRSLPLQAVSLAELSAMTGMSGRSLQLGFQKYRGYTPVECSRQIRLESAREMLMHATPGKTVLEIAMDCGFTHQSRFAASYFRQFHESPSETMARRKNG